MIEQDLHALAAAAVRLTQMAVMAAWQAKVDSPRNADPKRLARYGYKVYSQNDEDGIIDEIFRRIEPTARTFVEFGVGPGTECNTVKLLVEGWSGLWIESNPDDVAAIRQNFAPFIDAHKLVLQEGTVTAENINALLDSNGLRGVVDLLSIDIDFNDYWVWRAIETISPRVVVIEYNATLRPPLSLVVPYQPDAKWDGSNYFGASLEAMVRLGTQKGYRVVGCSLAGGNAFFVRDDLCDDKFYEPATAQAHYEPPLHYLHLLPAGHRLQPGLFEESP